MPLDQMHPENPASHPELLDWLAQDTFENGYNIARLIRGLVLSEAYSRSSRYLGAERPDNSLFAVANLKPLSPRQYAASLAIASRNPSHWEDPAAAEKRIRDEVKSHRGWANKFVIPAIEFQVSVDEALLLSNDSAFEDKIKVANHRLAGEMAKADSPEKMLELAFKAVYSRLPTSEETKTISSYLSSRAERREEAISQIVWALLTSSELRFNH